MSYSILTIIISYLNEDWLWIRGDGVVRVHEYNEWNGWNGLQRLQELQRLHRYTYNE